MRRGTSPHLQEGSTSLRFRSPWGRPPAVSHLEARRAAFAKEDNFDAARRKHRSVDTLDIAIFRELMQESIALPLTADPTRSLRSIAKRVGVDKDTVRNRVRRLQAQRFLRAPFVFPNPTVVGLVFEQHWVDLLPGRSEEVVERLKQRDDIAVISLFLGGGLTYLELRAEGEGGGRTAGPGVQRQRSAPLPFPPVTAKLTAQDWKVIGALQEDPGGGVAGVARRLKIAPRTAARRLTRLVEHRAMFVIPGFDPSAVDGTVVDFTVFYAKGAHKSAVDRQILDRVKARYFHADLGDPGHSFFNFIVNNAAVAAAILAWARTLPGVEEARIDFVVERIERVENVQGMVERARVGGVASAPKPRTLNSR